jgi:hypothetical protein
MTTMKHALGYNKDGILGVAGLLNGLSSAAKFLGFSAMSNKFGNEAGVFAFLNSPTANAQTTVSPLVALPSSYAGGNGIHAYVLQAAYLQSGLSTLVYTKDGVTLSVVETLGSNINLVAGSQTASIQYITYSEEAREFFLKVYINVTGQSNIFKTSDFETFVDLGVSPIGSYTSSNIIADGSGKLYMADSMGGQAYFSTNGGTTWTASTFYGPGGSSAVSSNNLRYIGKTSTGQVVLSQASSIIISAEPWESSIDYITTDFANGYLATSMAIQSGSGFYRPVIANDVVYSINNMGTGFRGLNIAEIVATGNKTQMINVDGYYSDSSLPSEWNRNLASIDGIAYGFIIMNNGMSIMLGVYELSASQTSISGTMVNMQSISDLNNYYTSASVIG